MNVYGYLEYQPLKRATPQKYEIKTKTTTIGSSLASDIRVKTKNPHYLGPDCSCLIEVNDNGAIILKCEKQEGVLVNGAKPGKALVLKTGDIIEVAGKIFKYIETPRDSKVPRSVKVKNRQSVLPNFKPKTITSKIPVMAKSASKMRRSLSLSSPIVKKQPVKRSCSSALPDKRRKCLDPASWQTTSTPEMKATRPSSFSTTKKRISIRKSLFLKSKIDISIQDSSLGDMIDFNSFGPEPQIDDLETSERSTTPVLEENKRGIKRPRETAGDSTIKLCKRRHVEDLFNNDASPQLRRSQRKRRASSFGFDESEYDLSGLKSLLSVSKEVTLNNLDVTAEILKNPNEDKSEQNSPLNDLSGVRRVVKTPKNDLTKIEGVKKLFATPKEVKSPLNDLSDVRGVKKLFETPGKGAKSPLNDLSDVKGVKKLLKTPGKVAKSPLNDLSDVKGVKKLLKTPGKVAKSPLNDLSDVRGVKKLFKTPGKGAKSPLNDLSNVSGVKKLFNTPKIVKSPLNDLSNVKGVKKLLKTPGKSAKSPLNDLSDVKGVKKLLKTPGKVEKSPLNDLSDVRGVKKLFETPGKGAKSPLNDLSNVSGVKKLFNTPKIVKSPLNDLSNVKGVKKLLKTPGKTAKSPLNDLSDVKGVKKLLKTPGKVAKSPLNDLTQVHGVKKLFSTPKEIKSPLNDLTNVSGVKDLLRTSLNDLYQEGVNVIKSSLIAEAMQKMSETPSPMMIPSTVRSTRSAKKSKENINETPKNIKSPIIVLEEHTDDQENVEDVETNKLKRTRGRKRVVDVEMPEKRTRSKRMENVASGETEVLEKQTRGKKKLNNNNTPQLNEDIEEVKPVKRTRARKKIDEDVNNESPKLEKSTRNKKRNNEDIETNDESLIKPKRTRGRKVEDDNKTQTPVMNEEIKEKRNRGNKKKVELKEKETPVNNSSTKKTTRGRGRKQINMEENVKDKEDEINVETPVKTTRSRRKKIEEETIDDNSSTKTSQRRGRKKTDKKEDVEIAETTRGKRNAKKHVEEVQEIQYNIRTRSRK